MIINTIGCNPNVVAVTKLLSIENILDVEEVSKGGWICMIWSFCEKVRICLECHGAI